MRNFSTSSSGRGWPLIALGAMLWSVDFLLRPALLTHPGFTAVRVVLYEHIALAAIFLPLLAARRAEWRKSSPREWLALVYIAWAGSAVATVLLTLAYKSGNPLTATLLQKTQPLFAVLLAGLVLREKRQPLFWALFAGAMVATYLLSFGLVSPWQALASPTSVSVACALGASFLWGSCTVVGRIALAEMPPPLVAGWRFVLALPLLFILNSPAIFSRSAGAEPVFQASALLLLGGIVVFPDILGMVFYYAGLRSTPASLATLAEIAYPAAALLLDALFGHHRLQVAQWLGIAALLLILQLVQSTKAVSAGDNVGKGRASPVVSKHNSIQTTV